MTNRRMFSLLFSGAVLLGITLGAAPLEDLIPLQPFQDQIIKLADAQNQIRMIELDSRVVEAVVVVPASPGGVLLERRLQGLGLDQFERITTNLYDFILSASVPSEVLIPDAEFAVSLAGVQSRRSTGTLTTDPSTILPLATREAWGLTPVTANPVRFTVRDAQGNPYTGNGFRVTMNIAVGRLLPGNVGHNPEGTDECIKLSSCQLVCNPPEE